MTDEDRITHVAHALCVADGQDPDADHMLHALDETRGRLRETVVPRWTTYTEEARRFVAAARALGIMEHT